MNLAIIKRLEFINDRFSDLKVLGDDGAAVIHKTMGELPPLTLAELKSLEIGLARYLCIDEEQSQIPATLREQMNQSVDTAELNVESFNEIMKRGNGTLDERIDVLNSLVEQFSSADQRLLDLHADHPQFLLKSRLESFRQQISDFSQRATHDLAQLLREKKPWNPSPAAQRPHVRHSAKSSRHATTAF